MWPRGSSEGNSEKPGSMRKGWWQNLGARRGARSGCECQFHNITSPSGYRLFECVDGLAKLVVWLVPCDDLLTANTTWLISSLLSTVDVPFDTPNAECVSTLEDLCTLCNYRHLAVAAVDVALEAAELLAVCFDDAVHEQNLDKD